MTQDKIDKKFDEIVSPQIHKPVDKQLGQLMDMLSGITDEGHPGYPEDREPQLLKKVWK